MHKHSGIFGGIFYANGVPLNDRMLMLPDAYVRNSPKSVYLYVLMRLKLRIRVDGVVKWSCENPVIGFYEYNKIVSCRYKLLDRSQLYAESGIDKKPIFNISLHITLVRTPNRYLNYRDY